MAPELSARAGPALVTPASRRRRSLARRPIAPQGGRPAPSVHPCLRTVPTALAMLDALRIPSAARAPEAPAGRRGRLSPRGLIISQTYRDLFEYRDDVPVAFRALLVDHPPRTDAVLRSAPVIPVRLGPTVMESSPTQRRRSGEGPGSSFQPRGGPRGCETSQETRDPGA